MRDYNIEQMACNPVGKVRVIVDMMTKDQKKANKIMSVMTFELTGNEINEFYDELKNKSNQLKLLL
ncbi:MAG: hypothetical protein Unbinned4585contig1001_4 [Prokaryotic dsDNA virus sp.]|nr:MAG: hypothetical protein Unbinned4585contig1001_4 [Prokaryotic dsDNA virus sp.]|tara:strand:+ start:807 stop:1004 length:198 start_codon:yes stop_codon:yes gene_type:complete